MISTFRDILSVDYTDYSDSLLGSRYLCRKHTLLLAGDPGVGKSSLLMQAAANWACGRALWGFKPSRALRILFIQAENDPGDLAEMAIGALKSMQLTPVHPDVTTISQNLSVVSSARKFGPEFIEWVEPEIVRFKADLVIVDPLLAFLGCDIINQAQVTEFLRGGIQGISDKTGVAWILAHHPSQSGAKQGGSFAYAMGSTELANFPRAVVHLVKDKKVPGEATLHFPKRASRTDFVGADGKRLIAVRLKHASDGSQAWEMMDPGVAPPQNTLKARAFRQPLFSDANLQSIIADCCTGDEALKKIIQVTGYSRKQAQRRLAKLMISPRVAL